MATRTIRVDDIDGTEGEVRTINFGVDNTMYEIDLASDNEQRLFEALDPFIRAARKQSKQSATGTTRKRSASSNQERTRAIRAWASENGIQVSDRGRISQEVQDKYDEAMSK